VYPLLEDAPAWLPYGTLQAPDETLDATLKVLEQHTLSSQPLTPGVSGQWVEMVHRKLDESTLRDGWQQRLDVMLGRIHQNSIQRNPTRVSDLIREESVDEISVIVAKPANLPDAPGKREAVSISRWQLRPFVNDASGVEQSPRAWTWSFGDADPGVLPHWEPLETDAQLRRAFVVCVSPAVASYSKEAGLEIGTSGDEESPERALPPKRGYKPLHRESWAKHARAVAQAAERRTIEQDGVPGFLGNGLEARFGLTAAEVQRAAYASGVLHDLGKLQVSWQRWAEAWQKKKEAGYEHLEGLAHTDFDPDNFEDRAANRGFQPRRPPHAAASALVACGLLAQELRVAPEREGLLASAVLASVLAHHGGWLPHAPDMGIDPLWARWQPDLAAAHIEHTSAALIDELYRQKNRSGIVGELLDVTTTLDTLRDAWPLVSYLMRTLRLADQRATAEGSEGVC
jgi:CRISPR-associated endonuclease Cas3-HD